MRRLIRFLHCMPQTTPYMPHQTEASKGTKNYAFDVSKRPQQTTAHSTVTWLMVEMCMYERVCNVVVCGI